MFDASRHDESTWRARMKFVVVAIVLIGTFFLIAGHVVQVMPWLPWPFLAACLLMHVFMRHGHAGHDHHDAGDSRGRSNKPDGLRAPQPPEGKRS